MPVVYFDTNALYIEGYRDSFTAGSLTAVFTPIGVGIRVLHGADFLVNDAWTNYTRPDASAFASPDELMAYLQAEFAKRRPLDLPSITAVADFDLQAGFPLAVSRRNGNAILARADRYTEAFVTGICTADTGAGFIATATRNAITLDDWSAVAGTASLAVGQPYFLAPAGGITTTPDQTTSGSCLVRVGNATGPQTLTPVQSDPILL